MANLYISFCDVGHPLTHGYGQQAAVVDGPSVVSQVLTTSTSNAQSSAATKPFAYLVADAASYVVVGSNPNAQTETTKRVFLPANVPTIIAVEIGNKVAGVTIA